MLPADFYFRFISHKEMGDYLKKKNIFYLLLYENKGIYAIAGENDEMNEKSRREAKCTKSKCWIRSMKRIWKQR
jgi:hypothetical protein